jgi:succinate-semialdehyde dehydrogenase/glutarate-semialdehyde dehydrogenase
MSLNKPKMVVDISFDDPSLVQKGAFIDNKIVIPNGPEFTVVDPSTGKGWISLNSCTYNDVEIAVDAADKAFQSYRKVPARDRARLLLEWDRLIRENKSDIARMIVLETGKPFKEALGEVDYALTFSWWMAGEAERTHGSTVEGANPANRFVIIKQPLGVVGCLTAWNFPVALLVRKVATALAAGCTVVAKPSPETPISAVAVAILAQRAGFPAGVFNVLPCDMTNTPPIGKAICEHPVVQKVSFTGSTAVGKLLAAQCASTLKKLTLELGGNGAFIIFDDADLQLAIDSLMQCKFRNSGQTCVSAQRVYVQKSIYPKVAELLKKRIQSDVKVGSGFDETTTLGPLTTPRSVSKVQTHIKDAVLKGAKLEIGGNVPSHTDSNGYFFEPTLLTGVTDKMALSNEETFGPVLPLYEFETETEVVEKANNTCMGLTSYFFTENANRIWRMFEALETGNVGVNTGMTTSAEAPFGGWHDSGYGKEAGLGYAINEYLKVKTATWRVDFKH